MATDLEEALNAAGAAPLIQKQIDPVLLEYERRYAPVVRALPSEKWGSNVYYFNQRTAVAPGGFVTDGGARPITNSTYVQNQFTIRNLQSVGAVTGFAQQVTADLIGSLRATEIEGAARGLLWDIETAVEWGNAAATLTGPYPQFDGFDTIASTFSGATQNAIDFSGDAFSLSDLDEVIDMVESNVAMPVDSTDWMFVASPTLISRIAQLQTAQQRFVDTVEVATGLIALTYRNIPLIKSSFLNPRSNVMGTVTATTATTGGTLADDTWKYRVSAVIARFGEIQASAEVAQTSTGGGLSVNTLSFTPPSGPDGAVPILYKVYRSTTTNTETLLGVVDAAVALASDGVTPIVANQIVDTGATLIPQNSTGPTQPGTPVAAYVGTNTGMKPLGSGDQNFYLLSRDPNFVVRPYVRDLTPVELYPTTSSPDSLPFAFVSDTCLAVRAPKYLGRGSASNAVLS